MPFSTRPDHEDRGLEEEEEEEEEELDVVLLALAVKLRAYRNRRQSSIRSRALFEYKHFSFSLDLIGPGRAHVLFRFSVEEIQRLSPLLHLQEMPLQAMAAAVEAQGGGPGIWGFQAIVTPDGLVVSLVGPFPGPTNDWTMWGVSGYEEALRQLCIGRQTLRVYGDPAYANTFGTLCPFEHPQGRHWLPPNEREYNARLLSGTHFVSNTLYLFSHLPDLLPYFLDLFRPLMILLATTCLITGM
ncbi:hypothetical protein VE00_08802 [Pseudogymnoascus sp. WSF 3629]|nr:hypothetical protein VE00_08802 [Pseudogymnoascus sp. WSF 3629]